MKNDSESQHAQIPFDDVIAALRDEDHPFPARFLHRLSALEGEELGVVSRVWFELSTQRRLGLLEDMETLTESDAVMDFDRINRIALGDEDARVRVTAVRALWPSEEPDLLPRLFDLLENDEHEEVRAQAASALGRFVYLGELGKITEADYRAVKEHLLAVMENNSADLVKRRALEALGWSSQPEVVDLIEQAYERDDDEWVAAALFAMGRSADDRWGPAVIERLRDNEVEISREAARAAGEMELSEALPALLDLLHEEDSELRLAAAWSLSQIGGNGVEESLEELLERTENEDEIDLIEDALENISLTDEMADMSILDFSPEDLDSLVHPDSSLDEDPDPAAD